MTAGSELAGLLRRGLAVFPLPPGSKTAAPGWHRLCTTDPAAAARWPAGSNAGVGCRASSIVGLDLDRHPGRPDGVASFARLAGEHGTGWPPTFTVATPSGGLHLYFRVSAGDGFASVIGWLPGVDIRGPGRRAGGYLAGPGSVTAAGRYVVAADVEVAPLPGWLFPLLPAVAAPGRPGRRALAGLSPDVPPAHPRSAGTPPAPPRPGGSPASAPARP